MDNKLIKGEVIAVSNDLSRLVARLDILVERINAVDGQLDDAKQESKDLKAKIDKLCIEHSIEIEICEKQISQLENVKKIFEDIVHEVKDNNGQLVIPPGILANIDIALAKCTKPLSNRFCKGGPLDPKK